MSGTETNEVENISALQGKDPYDFEREKNEHWSPYSPSQRTLLAYNSIIPKKTKNVKVKVKKKSFLLKDRELISVLLKKIL